MDRKLLRIFIISIIGALKWFYIVEVLEIKSSFFLVSLSISPDSCESNLLSTIINSEHDLVKSTTALKNVPTSLNTTTIVPYLITKPNSYLYNPEEDEDILLGRVKRDTTPFVCKSKIFIFSSYHLLLSLFVSFIIYNFKPMDIFLIDKIVEYIIYVHQVLIQLLFVVKVLRGIQ